MSSQSSQIVDELQRRYEQSVQALRSALRSYIQTGFRPDLQARADGLFTYPELRIHYVGNGRRPQLSRAYGRLASPGEYATTVTQPELFRAYLTEQLDMLLADFGVDVTVGASRQEIPFP